MWISITKKEELNFILSVPFDDDSYDLEVNYKDNCLFVFHIGNDGIIKLIFGKNENYIINLELAEEIIKEAKERLIKQQSSWLESKKKEIKN
jgi:hypothetical protein